LCPAILQDSVLVDSFVPAGRQAS